MDSYLRNTKTFSSPELDANRYRTAKTETAEPTIQADEILTVQLPETQAARGLQLNRRAETQSQANQQPELPNPEKRSVPLYETLKETPLELPSPALFLQEVLNLQASNPGGRLPAFEPIRDELTRYLAVSRQAALAPAIHRMALATVTRRASRRAVIPPATQALRLLRQ
jgi:hypothetical protein